MTELPRSSQEPSIEERLRLLEQMIRDLTEELKEHRTRCNEWTDEDHKAMLGRAE